MVTFYPYYNLLAQLIVRLSQNYTIIYKKKIKKKQNSNWKS